MVGGLIRRRGLILATFVLIAGALAVTSFGGVQLPTGFISEPSLAGYEGGAPDEPEATATFIKGNQIYDANLVWAAYSDPVKRALQRNGSSVAETQRQLDQMKRVGTKIESAQYIGGYVIPNGKMAFYAVINSSRGAVDYTSYVFRLDSSGKILEIL
jgi:hypothetical protein